jgi:hypothetical protein
MPAFTTGSNALTGGSPRRLPDCGRSQAAQEPQETQETQETRRSTEGCCVSARVDRRFPRRVALPDQPAAPHALPRGRGPRCRTSAHLRQPPPAMPRRQRRFVGELQLTREGRAPNGAGHVPAGEPEPPELVVWHELLDQRKELSLLKPDVCVKQVPRRTQRLSFDDASRHADFECASEPLVLHVWDACLAEGSGLRPDVPEQKREELFFLIAKVDTLVVPEELHEFAGRREPNRSIAVCGSTAQPHCLHESIVMVARERDQGGVTLDSTTLIRTRRTATRLSPPRSTSRRATARSRPTTTRPTCPRKPSADTTSSRPTISMQQPSWPRCSLCLNLRDGARSCRTLAERRQSCSRVGLRFKVSRRKGPRANRVDGRALVSLRPPGPG